MAKATSWTQVSLEAKVLRYKPDSYELFANWLERLGFPMTLEQVKAEVNRIHQDGKDKPESGASYFIWLWLNRAKAP
ncbi:hypothetical protein DA01_07430 [Dehalococcoides mccartyi]|uniref:Uncharacterized protein n=1 Tax=Dehalococcoides mccartyi TaxID=61435 RepID=A0A0V8M0H2_9CHLR|nr:hypothetical protein [Dehalococcoides mccartyi]KSV17283.1 hypothetical protein DA01_07430 [Dehalococcoides mccartyi]